jgi:tetratricopeptide (TPR) repeat protein
MSTSHAPATNDSREIRVFLSSTFRDMNAERDALLTQVFPELRRICRERGVNFTEIDLRWGVREEDSRNGLTVELCLQEVDRCREHPPFFIGFLGERYGWIPRHEDLTAYWQEHKDSPYAQRITQALDQGISVTELEMRYAFLENQHAADHAFVLLRSPKLTDALYAQSAQDGSQHREDFYDAAADKLDQLKSALRGGAARILDGYDSIEAYGDAVRKFLLEQIDLLYPADTALSPEQIRDRFHQAYAQARLQSYVPLPQLRAAVQQAITAQPARVLITADSGLGKSAFMADLAAWLPRVEQVWVHAHYIGADGVRALDGWVQRLYDALQASGGLNSTPPASDKERWEALPVALQEVQRALGRPLVLLLDALDQLSDAEDLQRLRTLLLPTQVALVASSTPLPSTQADFASWHSLTLPPLNDAMRRQAIDIFLQSYDKKLDAPLLDLIAQDEACAVPLFLRLLLEELRLHALYDTLPTLTRKLLATRTADQLFLHVLRALDRDFARADRKDLATRAAQFMALSWRGLDRLDLAFLLATAGDPIDPARNRPRLPDSVLSPLLAHLEPFCLADGGRIAILHAILRETLRNAADSTDLRRQLADYFVADEADAIGERSYQLFQLEDTPSLLRDLSRQLVVLTLWQTNPLLLRDILGHLGAGRSDPPAAIQTLAAAWEHAFSSTEEDLAHVPELDGFVVWMTKAAFTNLAIAWAQALLAWRRKTLSSGHPAIATSLNNLAVLYKNQGRLQEAEPLYQEALAIYRQALPSGHPSIANSLNNLAMLYKNQGRLDEAEPLLKEALAIRRQALPSGHPDIATSLNNLAGLYKAQGRLQEAEQLLLIQPK